MRAFIVAFLTGIEVTRRLSEVWERPALGVQSLLALAGRRVARFCEQSPGLFRGLGLNPKFQSDWNLPPELH